MASIVSCYVPPQKQYNTYNFNFASIYNPGETGLHPDCFIYHNSDTTSLLFFKINKSEFVPYSQAGSMSPTISVGMKYVLRHSENNQLADSGSYLYSVERRGENRFVSYVSIKTPLTTSYNLSVLISDQVRKTARRVWIDVDKNTVSSHQNFFLETTDSVKEPVFYTWIKGDRTYKLMNARNSNLTYRVTYYKPIFSIPQSPFASNYQPPLPSPDSILYVSIQDTLRFENQGIYIISDSSILSQGLCLTNFGSEYPEITSAHSMTEPLRYLTNQRRWNELMTSTEKKISVDKFWLSIAPDTKRARELIRIFYNRTQLANTYFASHQPGWQTDRGMIFVIMGAPATIYKSADTELWIYGDNPDLSSIQFTFNRNNNNLSRNDFVLVREQRYQSLWSQAIETWIKGKAFSVN